MKTQYAVVQEMNGIYFLCPDQTISGEYRYYVLNNKINFFDTLENAKDYLAKAFNAGNRGVVEFSTDDNDSVVSLDKLHEFSVMETKNIYVKKKFPDGTSYYEKQVLPSPGLREQNLTWSYSAKTQSALAEQYKNFRTSSKEEQHKDADPSFSSAPIAKRRRRM